MGEASSLVEADPTERIAALECLLLSLDSISDGVSPLVDLRNICSPSTVSGTDGDLADISFRHAIELSTILPFCKRYAEACRHDLRKHSSGWEMSKDGWGERQRNYRSATEALIEFACKTSSAVLSLGSEDSTGLDSASAAALRKTMSEGTLVFDLALPKLTQDHVLNVRDAAEEELEAAIISIKTEMTTSHDHGQAGKELPKTVKSGRKKDPVKQECIRHIVELIDEGGKVTQGTLKLHFKHQYPGITLNSWGKYLRSAKNRIENETS